MPGQPDSSRRGDGLPGAAARALLRGWVATGFQNGGKRKFGRFAGVMAGGAVPGVPTCWSQHAQILP